MPLPGGEDEPAQAIALRLIDLPIEDELKDSYLTYAMSVIVAGPSPTSATASSPRSGGSSWR